MNVAAPRGRRAALLFVILAGNAALAQSPSWLDRPLETWNRSAIPPPPASTDTRAALTRRCASLVATGAAADAVAARGWTPILHLDRRILRDDVEVVGGMAAADPACTPGSFNLFVFAGGRFAGTLSPVPMNPSRDGAAGAVRITGADTLTAEFARYAPADAECCPSSVVRVSYRITRAGGAPVLEALEARRVR